MKHKLLCFGCSHSMPGYIPSTITENGSLPTDQNGSIIPDQSDKNKKSFWDFLFDKDLFDVTIFSTPGNGIQLWSTLINYGLENNYLNDFDTLIIQQTSEPRWFFSHLSRIKKFFLFQDNYVASNINNKHYVLDRNEVKHHWQTIVYKYYDNIVEIPDVDYIISTFPHRIISDCKKYKKNILLFNYNFCDGISYPNCYIPFNNEPIYFDLPNIENYLQSLTDQKKYKIDKGHATEQGMQKVADILRQAGILNFFPL